MDWLQLTTWPEWLIALYIGWNTLRALGNWLKGPVGDNLPVWVNNLLKRGEVEQSAEIGFKSQRQSLDYLRSKEVQEREGELITRLAGYLIDDQTDALKRINDQMDRILEQAAVQNKLLEALSIILKQLIQNRKDITTK